MASGEYGRIEVWPEAVMVVSEGGARPPSVDDAVGADFIGFVVNTAWQAGLHSCVTRGLAEQCDLYNCTVGGDCRRCHQVNCLAAASVGAASVGGFGRRDAARMDVSGSADRWTGSVGGGAVARDAAPVWI